MTGMNDEEMFQGAVSLARGFWPREDPEAVTAGCLSSLVGAEGLPMALGLMVLRREAHEDGRIGTLG